MLCKKPYSEGALSFGCGQCMPCKLNRRRVWTHRIMLEATKHGQNSFVTLTYNDEHLPKGGSLAPKDTQDWLKRLRKAVFPVRLRYYLVGEYGDDSLRPHYHVALFGLGVDATKIVEETWGLGHVVVGTLTPESAQYVAGYVTKKLTNKDLSGRGLHPQFTRMSLKPGIGAMAMDDVKDVLESEYGQKILFDNQGDVPVVLQHGRSKLPLGRYLRRKLRQSLGFVDLNTPPAAKRLMALEMQIMQKLYVSDPKNKKEFHSVQQAQKNQKIMNMEGRQKIYSNRGLI